MKAKLTIVLMLFIPLAQAQMARPYDIVIDEIMADPSPAVGLPNTEFVELKNISAVPINLYGWNLSDAGSMATIRSNFILQPDSFVLLCPNSAVALLTVFGSTIGVSNFPSLNNDGDQIWLRSREGNMIHAVDFSVGWYQNELKKGGGWTMEMVDTKNPCSGMSNWVASIHSNGGTPGTINSVNNINKDLQPPAIRWAFATDSLHVTLVFDEPIDSAQAVNPSRYIISDGVGSPQSASATLPFFNRVVLQLSTALERNKVYEINAREVTDCAGNAIGAYHTVKLGWAHPSIDSFHLVVNEILFNPWPDGVDYIEIYNRSNKIFDLKDFYLANRSSDNSIASIQRVCTESRLIFPQEYLVLTEDPGIVKRQYLAKDPAAFTSMSALPSYPNTKGNVVLLNAQGSIIDELSYDENWHFKLIDNKQGIALERTNYHLPTQNFNNWHSAASHIGFGTPGYQNSQYRSNDITNASISIEPKVFSPDNDGFDDYTSIHYQFPEPGYVCNIRIYDASGRPVRNLTRNAICGLKGFFRWDGLDDKNLQLPIGVYVVYTEVFNLQGKTNYFKHAITLARRLN
jgi:hypothetical protein